jgi:hypothetical protein
MKLQFSRQIIEKFSHNLFYENPSSGTRVVPWGQTDRRTDMTKLKIAFLNFAKGTQKLNHPIKILRGNFRHYHRQCRPIPRYFVVKNHKISGPLKLLEWNWYRNNHNNFGP